MIHFEKITKDNYRECIRLRVKENQINYVAPNVNSLARAYVYFDTSRPFAVYENEVMVGFALLRIDEELEVYIVDQFMIDGYYQGRGYGKQSMELLLQMIKEEKMYSRILLCYIEGDKIAKKLYTELGFHCNGEVDEDEVTMELNI